MKNRIVMIVSLIAMIGMVNEACATYHRVRDERKLNRILDSYELVVVLFYNKNAGQEPIKQIFRQLSRGYSYDQADVAFVSINVARESGAAIAREYGIRKTPALVVFEDGGLLIGKDRTPIVETDVRSASDIRIFINTYFGDRIEDVIREKEERDRERRRRRGPSSGSGFHFGISYGYPYYPYYGYPFGYSYGYPIIYW